MKKKKKKKGGLHCLPVEAGRQYSVQFIFGGDFNCIYRIAHSCE